MDRLRARLLPHRAPPRHNFITGTLLPHQNKTPDDPYIRTIMAQMGAIEPTLQLLANLE
ncbi:hypothetical protein ABZ650_33115 [Streptomyces griseoviridis]|uniref:hypothetical protein n=1 Tax=Streptomyces griseoviridis TaxID=45398 RepID=UPI0033F2695F